MELGGDQATLQDQNIRKDNDTARDHASTGTDHGLSARDLQSRRSSRPHPAARQQITVGLPLLSGPVAGAKSVRSGRLSLVLNTAGEGMSNSTSSVGIANNAVTIEPEMDDMLFLFDVFDIELLPEQLAQLKHLGITSISGLCHLRSDQASTLEFPPNFFAVLWFLDRRREWLPKKQILDFPDAREKVRFV